VILTSVYSRHPPFVEFVWFLRHHLGGALRALLPLQSTALLAPLPPRAPRFRLDCRRCSQLYLYGDRQLPNFAPWIGYTPETEGVRRPGCEGCHHCWYLYRVAVLAVHLHGSADLRHPWVSFGPCDSKGLPLLTLHLLHRLDGDEVIRHRLRKSWTLHFASKETADL
jgi:hypothetical protein